MLTINSKHIEGFAYLFQGGLKNVERIGNTIATATPLILTGLSVAFAFRTGLFNIGAAGQMLFGGFCATAVGLTVNAPRPLLLVLMVVAGILGGAAVAIIPGILKAKFNVHEVVSTIMMNWTVFWFVYYMVPKYFKGQYETESRPLEDAALFKLDWLSNLFEGSYINLGIILAIVAIILIGFILNKTTLGYELKAVGFNRHAAEYAGIPVNKNLTVYTSLPEEGDAIIHVDRILETLLKKHSLILIDTDFSTPVGYFKQSQETYLVQTLDVLTIQPLTAFLRELKAKNILNEKKLRVILNKTVKIRGITEKTIIGGMAYYNDPAMSFMTELFDRTLMKYVAIPFEEETYIKYLENIIECNISLKGYSKIFMQTLKELANMVYSQTNTYRPPTANGYNMNNTFTPNMNNTLNQMKNNY